MNRATAAFAALAQPSRMAAFRLLVRAGPEGMAAGEIARRLQARANTTSANLSVLLRAGLVSNRREGREIRYFANMQGLRAMLEFLLEDCCGGRAELCRPILAEALQGARVLPPEEGEPA